VAVLHRVVPGERVFGVGEESHEGHREGLQPAHGGDAPRAQQEDGGRQPAAHRGPPQVLVADHQGGRSVQLHQHPALLLRHRTLHPQCNHLHHLLLHPPARTRLQQQTLRTHQHSKGSHAHSRGLPAPLPLICGRHHSHQPRPQQFRVEKEKNQCVHIEKTDKVTIRVVLSETTYLPREKYFDSFKANWQQRP